MLTVEPVAHLKHSPLAMTEVIEEIEERIAAHRLIRHILRHRRVRVGDELAEGRSFLIANRLFEGDGRLGASLYPLDLARRYLQFAGDLLDPRYDPALG